MMKLIRWLVTLLLIAIVGALIAAQFVTLNQFKDLAAQKVRQATGRELKIVGDIKLSFYPVLGAKIEKIALSNVLGGEQSSMVSVDKMVIGIKLLPLVHKRVELEKIILNKPVIYLEKNAAGLGNWEFPKTETASLPSEKNKAAVPPVRLGGIEITDGTLSYHDLKSSKPIVVTKLNAVANVIDMDSYARINADAEYNGIPIKIALETDSPSALLSEKGSATHLEAVVYGVSGKMEGKISVTPTHAGISDLAIAVQQVLAKGKIDIALGGAVPVLNGTLDFGVVNLEPMMEVAAVAPAAADKTQLPGEVATQKNNYIDPAVFKAVEGSIALSAESVQTKEWKLAQPKIRANMAGGIVATAAAGQFSTATQSPMNITFTTGDLVGLLRPEGGAFAITAKSLDKEMGMQGNLAFIPGLVALTNANIKYNNQTITGRATLTEKAGDQMLDAQLQLAKNGQQWNVSAKTPALQKLMQPEGSTVDVLLQSGTQAAEIKANFNNVDQTIKLNPLVLILNGGTGKGYITYDQKPAVPMLTVNLEFAALDVNPLLNFVQQPDAYQPESATATADAAPASRETPLRNLNAQVNIKATQLKAKNLQVSNVDLNASVKDGILNAALPDVGLYSGKATVKARVDGNMPDPQFNITTEGNDVNIGSLLVDAVQSNIFAGIGHWKADITGIGTKTPAVYKTLKGTGEFELQQGVIRGMDLFQLMSAARNPESLATPTDETSQIHAKGSFTVDQGVIANNDLVLQSPNIEASGKGGISLPLWQIDYRFEPKVGERRKGGQGEKFVGQSIPVIVKGSLDHPKIGPDSKALIDTGIDMLKKIKGVNKYLAPLGLDGSNPEPTATDGTTPAPTDEAAPTKKKKFNPLNSLRNLF